MLPDLSPAGVDSQEIKTPVEARAARAVQLDEHRTNTMKLTTFSYVIDREAPKN